MKFKEFTEYPNPLEADYDIKSSNQSSEESTPEQIKQPQNIHEQVFTSLYLELGCPEYEELEQFGITLHEFDNPTKETFTKLKQYAHHYQLKVSKAVADEIREYYKVTNKRNR